MSNPCNLYGIVNRVKSKGSLAHTMALPLAEGTTSPEEQLLLNVQRFHSSSDHVSASSTFALGNHVPPPC